MPYEVQLDWERCPDGYRIEEIPLQPYSGTRRSIYEMGFEDEDYNVVIIPNSEIREPFPLIIGNDNVTEKFGAWNTTRDDAVRLIGEFGFLWRTEKMNTEDFFLWKNAVTSIRNMLASIGQGTDHDRKRLIDFYNDPDIAQCAFKLEDRKDRLQLRLQPKNLQGFMLMEIATVAANGSMVRNCRSCGNPMVLGPGTGTYKSKAFCSGRCRTADCRKRQSKSSP